MAFMSLKDPDFWKNCPEDMKHMQEGRGTGNIAYFMMGERKDNPPTVACLKMQPGHVIPRHAHHCWRFEVIVQGTLDVGDRVLTVGDVMMSAPYVAYGPHTAGAEGCTTFEIFGDFKSSHRPIMEAFGKMIECDTSSRAGLQEVRDIQKKVREAEAAA